MLSAEFLITSVVVVLIPGTGVIYTVSTGIFMGWRASVAAAFGCTVGILPHLAASVCGISLLMHMSALAFQAVKFAGAAYLLYLAWSMWRETGGLPFEGSRKDRGMMKVALKGFLINILNPKLSIFFLAFLPLFVPADAASPVWHLMYLSGVFMALTLGIFILYGVFAHSISACIVRSPKQIVRMQRTFAGIFAFLGVKLAMAE